MRLNWKKRLLLNSVGHKLSWTREEKEPSEKHYGEGKRVLLCPKGRLLVQALATVPMVKLATMKIALQTGLIDFPCRGKVMVSQARLYNLSSSP